MTTLILVLCSNFNEIGCREVGEMMCCIGDKKLAKYSFLRPFWARLAGLFVKFRPNWFWCARVIPKKWFCM